RVKEKAEGKPVPAGFFRFFPLFTSRQAAGALIVAGIILAAWLVRMLLS
ncbi:MAG: hypothetical protein JRI97_02990, partial [Deltaproteobacteria bacterium]|nr:hypothetical protein [Deltaproteobacteria bacterium]